MNCRVSGLFLLISLVPFLSSAAESEQAPTLELLEFLGQWETDEGEWIDPSELDNDKFVELLDATATEDENE